MTIDLWSLVVFIVVKALGVEHINFGRARWNTRWIVGANRLFNSLRTLTSETKVNFWRRRITVSIEAAWVRVVGMWVLGDAILSRLELKIRRLLGRHWTKEVVHLQHFVSNFLIRVAKVFLRIYSSTELTKVLCVLMHGSNVVAKIISYGSILVGWGSLNIPIWAVLRWRLKRIYMLPIFLAQSIVKKNLLIASIWFVYINAWKNRGSQLHTFNRINVIGMDQLTLIIFQVVNVVGIVLVLSLWRFSERNFISVIHSNFFAFKRHMRHAKWHYLV